MWEKHRFTSFDLSGSSMDFETMYWYLREAFVTQQPRVVVIDIRSLGERLSPLDSVQKRNIANMPFGLNKIGAGISAEIPNSEKEKWILPFEQYHALLTTSNETTDTCFSLDKFSYEAPNIIMGYRFSNNRSVVEEEFSQAPFNEEQFSSQYHELKKSLDFLHNKKCKVVLINSPSKNSNRLMLYEDELKRRIASEYSNVLCYFPRDYREKFHQNFNTEMLDEVHLNAEGAQRFSAVLSDYLAKVLGAHHPPSPEIAQIFSRDLLKYRLLMDN